MFELPPNSHRC